MVLKSLNDLSKYKLDNVVEYNNTFHGHQKGILLCSVLVESGEIETVYLPEHLGTEEERKQKAQEILDDKTILTVEQRINVLDNNGDLITKALIYLPYVVKGHSCLEPTINFANIPGIEDINAKAKIELLFVSENLNRYAVIEYNTSMMSVIDIVYHCLAEPIIFNQLGCVMDDGDESFTLDFYNEAGEKIDLSFPNVKRLLDCLVSVRLIGLELSGKRIEEVLRNV